MDSNSTNPQEEKKGFLSKLFGGGKKDETPAVSPADTTPPANDPGALASAPEPAAMDASAQAPATTPMSDITPPPINSTDDPVGSPTPSFSSPVEDIPPADTAPAQPEVPAEDVAQVDTALDSLPPMPVAPDEPQTSVTDTPSADIASQSPVEPMVGSADGGTDVSADSVAAPEPSTGETTEPQAEQQPPEPTLNP